jgi:phospholipase/carboxylesterase/glyoxalase family protein
MSATHLGHVHQFVPGNGTDDIVLLMLHGTGGDEHDLIPLARALRPGAAVLSPRGNVLEKGMPRFFRRLAEGVLDLDDLARRTDELTLFIGRAAEQYGIDSAKLVAVGFSNGANIAASVLLRHPGTLRRAVLLSPMLPFEPETNPALTGTSVFIGAGRRDAIIPIAQAERLGELLKASGADVTLLEQDGGHTITNDELTAVRTWLSR